MVPAQRPGMGILLSRSLTLWKKRLDDGRDEMRAVAIQDDDEGRGPVSTS